MACGLSVSINKKNVKHQDNNKLQTEKCCRRWRKCKEKREGKQEEARTSKDVQKQDGTRKVVEALSDFSCKCLLGPFWNRSLAKITQCESTPAHSHDAVRLALRPELGVWRGGGGQRGLGRALRCPHSGLVEPLSQVLLILPNILL